MMRPRNDVATVYVCVEPVDFRIPGMNILVQLLDFRNQTQDKLRRIPVSAVRKIADQPVQGVFCPGPVPARPGRQGPGQSHIKQDPVPDLRFRIVFNIRFIILDGPFISPLPEMGIS